MHMHMHMPKHMHMHGHARTEQHGSQTEGEGARTHALHLARVFLDVRRQWDCVGNDHFLER